MATKFFLRTKQTNGTANLYTRINRPKLSISNWYICTNISVSIESWNKAEKSPKALNAYYATDEGKAVQKRLNEVEALIRDSFANGTISAHEDKGKLERLIADIVNEEGIKAKEETEQRKKEREEKELCVIWNYYKYFLNAIKKGDIRAKGKEYKRGSISVWETFGKHLKAYLSYKYAESMTFDQINRSFAGGFVSFLEGKELMIGTINQQITCFRRLCNAAVEDEKCTNAVSVKVWHERKAEDNEKRTEIALTDREINALYDMPLEGMREKVRDIWMIGFLSAQRVSDYSKLTRDNFKQTPNGLNVIVLKQKKTGNDITIPILDERVFELCRKYNYNFPKVSKDYLNDIIKQILKDLSVTVPSLAEWSRTLLCMKERQKEEAFISMRKRVEGGERLHGEELKRYKKMLAYAVEHESGDKLFKRDFSNAVIKQKWEMVSSHTSRRSAVTSLYNTGLFDAKDIMSISGHTTLKNFETYIRRGAIEQAESIAEKFAKAKEVTLKTKEA